MYTKKFMQTTAIKAKKRSLQKGSVPARSRAITIEKLVLRRAVRGRVTSLGAVGAPQRAERRRRLILAVAAVRKAYPARHAFVLLFKARPTSVVSRALETATSKARYSAFHVSATGTSLRLVAPPVAQNAKPRVGAFVCLVSDVKAQEALRFFTGPFVASVRSLPSSTLSRSR